ncbi:alpha/beta fold hydrolase [Mycobacterium vicinigordonae]|uniref:Alpha/beta hydrolase n=1 Tax=Mycobacterium vicinigordonae TaxID=1719132 RepID=A0A7D6I5V6_9MYCO|nr:alpha/beta hydrolase [Mycobacterium vicinigordonae]QLL07658.1 alpha/beta hydrolase [Mycobacterium vicinigordonae]
MRVSQKRPGIRRLAVVILVVTALLAGCAGSTRSSRETTSSLAQGDFAGPVEIGNGRHLYLECRGQGTPTVILESGYHNSSDPWSQADASPPATGPAVLTALAREHRVCAYDRPGTLRNTSPPAITDRSSAVPMPRTANDVVGDLHALLDAAHVPGPFILVGHSLGGLFVRLYAQTHPEQVRAVVFVDAFGVEIPSLMGPDWPAYRRDLDQPPAELTDSKSFETVDIDACVAQVAAAAPFPAVATAVLTRTEPFRVPSDVSPDKSAKLEEAWRAAAARLVELRPQTPHIVATGSDHFIQVQQPDLVTVAVGLVIQRSASR